MIFNGVFVLESGATEVDKSSAAESVDAAETSQPLEDESVVREDSVTAVDEDGNITEVGDTDGTVEDAESDQPALKAKSRMAAPAAKSSTVYVVNFNTKSNATTSYTEYGTGEAGYTNGDYGADAAYLGTSGNKIKFMMSGVVGLVNKSEVQLISLSKAKVVSGYYVSGGRLIHGIVCDMTTPGYRTTLDNGKAPSYLKSGVTYYSYDGHYFYKDYATMLSDYKSNTRSHSVNPNDPYYNYYQYLPMRSTTAYSSSEMKSMINSKVSSSSKMYNSGSSFVTNQNTYGVNALLMAGIAANESAWGTSTIAKEKNNLFGLNAVDESPYASADKFKSVSYCIQDFANGWLSQGYLYPKDWRYYGAFLGNKGGGLNVKYASDPYWGEKAANMAYSLDKAKGSKDYDRYTIGVVGTVGSGDSYVNVRNKATTSSSSKVLYNTGSTSNYPVALLSSEKTGSFYKIQSDGVLNGSRTALSSSSGKYDFDKMYAYIYADYVLPVNDGTSTPGEDPEPATLSSIAVTKAPTKTTYTEGEEFNASGMKVTATWSDGSKTDVTGSVTYSKTALKTSDKSVKISYTSGGVTKTTSQSITVKAKATVESVEINPSEVKMERGSSQTFGVAVKGNNDPPLTVSWSVSGSTSEDTCIDENGKLTVAGDEKSDTLTVTAVSTYDENKMAMATVSVVDKPSVDVDTEEPVTVERNDEETGITVSAEFGEGINAEDVKLTVETIDEAADAYQDLIKPVADKTILGVYDVTLSKTSESITLTFDVGSEYEGKDVTVIHYADHSADAAAGEGDAAESGEGFMETYPSTVEAGKVTVTLTSLSPVVLAINEPAGGTVDGNGDGNTGDGSGSAIVKPDGDTVTEDDSLTGDQNGNESTDNGSSDNGQSSDTVQNGELTGDTSDDKDQTGNDTNKDSDNGSQQKEEAKEETSSGDQNGTDEQQASAQNDESAATGDSFYMGMWIMLMTASALGAVSVLLTRKKKAGSRR